MHKIQKNMTLFFIQSRFCTFFKSKNEQFSRFMPGSFYIFITFCIFVFTNSIDSTYSARITHSAFRKFNPCFAQPAINSALLMQRLSRYNVTLERSTITNSTSRTGKQPQFKFKGTILCKNLDFTKTVKVHYSTDNWESSNDTIAKWRRSNLDGSHDVFEFEQDLQETAKGEIKSVQFCIRYNTSCQEFWDNNDGKNYSFQ